MLDYIAMIRVIIENTFYSTQIPHNARLCGILKE